MANNNLALSKRPRNIPTHNETVCASIAAARAPQACPCTTTCLVLFIGVGASSEDPPHPRV
eukprot:scaffold31476_cov121-Isochrysis_galbana.AAC.3